MPTSLFDLTQFFQADHWPPQINPMALACALVAAAGMFLLLSALGVIGGRGPRVKLSKKISLAEENHRISGTDLENATLIERLFAPIAAALSQRSSVTEREWVERAYDLLDRKKGSADYYLRRVVYGMSGFAGGIVVGLVIATTTESLIGLLLIPAVLSAGMYQLPKIEITNDLARRREQMMFEVPYVLDKLTVNIIANNNLIQGMERTVQQANGGYLLREFLQVVEDNAKNTGLQNAFLRMARRNEDVPMVVRIAMRLAMTEETGAAVVNALQATGDRAIELVENLIQTRGEQNNLMMVAPSMLALLGVLIAVAGPSIGPMLMLANGR